MQVDFLVLSFVVPVLAAFLSLCVLRFSTLSSWIGALGMTIGSGFGLASMVLGIAQRRVLDLKLAWGLPLGSFHLHLDALSGFFLALLFVLGPLVSIYGLKRSRPFSWPLGNLLFGSMALLVLSYDAILFLMTWEVMSLASYGLIAIDHQNPDSQSAGMTYLIATQLGTAFLFIAFFLCADTVGSTDFGEFSHIAAASTSMLTLVFSCFLVGFGTKAGLIPFHVWFADSYPPIQAQWLVLKSGFMVKTAIYALMRMLTFMGTPEPVWGLSLVLIGALSAVGGILFALSERDMMRLLAFSTIENVGLIILSLGVGLLGFSYQLPAISVLGIAGALFHVWNHAFIKALLLFGAGVVEQMTGSRKIDELGGLLKKMPKAGVLFFVGALCICALPPGNAFFSEFLIYGGAFLGATDLDLPVNAPFFVALLALVVVGGLVLATFAKIFGLTFLGSPRTDKGSLAHDPSPFMWLPMLGLAGACLSIGFFASAILPELNPVVEMFVPKSPLVETTLHAATNSMTSVSAVVSILFFVVLFLTFIRWLLLRSRPVAEHSTWGCGYTKKSRRMQYTATSFSEPLTLLFRPVTAGATHYTPPRGYFPQASSFVRHHKDIVRAHFYEPLFRAVVLVMARFRWIQHGKARIYVAYIVVTLLVLLTWKLG